MGAVFLVQAYAQCLLLSAVYLAGVTPERPHCSCSCANTTSMVLFTLCCVVFVCVQVVSWLKGHVSSKYPLVAASTLQASEAAVDRLQVMLPGLLPLGTAAVGEVAAAGKQRAKSRRVPP